MSDTHHRGVWDAPEPGKIYLDSEGRRFLVFSISAEFIYAEFGSGAIETLCRREWERLEPRIAGRPWDHLTGNRAA